MQITLVRLAYAVHNNAAGKKIVAMQREIERLRRGMSNDDVIRYHFVSIPPENRKDAVVRQVVGRMKLDEETAELRANQR